MAEERTLGLARAHEEQSVEPSKEELQRRLDAARDSISHTVIEIKETVANQVQAVKDTLDWREQFKKRPVAWCVGAAGVGFAVGYGVAALVKGEPDDEVLDYYSPESTDYAARPIISSGTQRVGAPPSKQNSVGAPRSKQNNGRDDGPGFLGKLSHTPAFGRVKDEASNIGDAFVKELGKTATQVVLPALMTSIKNFIGGYLPTSSATDATRSASMKNDSIRESTGSSYQPTLDREHS
jgi:hypothetical protein